MSRFLIPFFVMCVGVVTSVALRGLVTSRAGLVLTRPGGTYFLSLNVLLFWISLVLTMGVSVYLYFRRGSSG